MIERKFNAIIPHNKLRLHSAERNTKFGKIFNDYKKSLKEEDIRFYPNTEELKKPLSKFFGYDNFLMGFGSDRCIRYFFEAHRKKHWFRGRKKLLITEPSFPMYNVYGQAYDYKIKKIDYHVIKFPIFKFLDNIDKNSVVVISNPSSPIGDIIDREYIIKILEKGQPTLIDEAYIEFTNEESCIDLIDTYDNLYVTRTFSKAYGSAGTRFGCIFSQKKNIETLTQYRDMYEISGQTLRWIQTLCKNKKQLQKYIDDVKYVRTKLTNELYHKKIYSIPSKCNWIHVKESDLPELPDNIIFRKNCSIPERGNDWVRIGITDNLKDYDWILK